MCHECRRFFCVDHVHHVEMKDIPGAILMLCDVCERNAKQADAFNEPKRAESPSY